MILLDTNIFLELLLDRKKAGECEELLDRVAEGAVEAVVTKFTVHAIEALVDNPKTILTFLKNLNNSVGLEVYDTSLEEESAVPWIMETTRLDFDDALQYYVAQRSDAEAIVSFDKHFDGLDIPRKEPKEFAT
ncbi:MAG: type II toxin-antitoxin system VapC family toxin [Thaumarchaeota archaeon]|nr:type II toxin-antitoxin system VapC family toxin [Nitrososphaerota archaeon]